jgi:hypothetical protein
MRSATRRRGAYGGEYLRAGLRLRARGGRIKTKEKLVNLDKRLQETQSRRLGLKTDFRNLRDLQLVLVFIGGSTRGRTLALRGVHAAPR